jgi:protein-tyrosine phosphatase
MKTDLYPVGGPWTGRLAVAPRPRGGDWLDDEVGGWQTAGIDTVVSLLTPAEVSELELGHEERFCRAHQLQFLSFPIEDRDVPESSADFSDLVTDLLAALNAGASVVVHCRQGIGRAGLVALGVLIRAGLTPPDAVRRVSAARGRPVPETREQQEWIERFALLPASAE